MKKRIGRNLNTSNKKISRVIKKPKVEKDKLYTFSVQINDGFCCYEYSFKTGDKDVSIYDIACAVAKKLKCEVAPGKFIKK